MAIGKFVIKQIKKNPWIFKSVVAIGISYLGSRTTCHAKVSNAREVHTADLNMRAEVFIFGRHIQKHVSESIGELLLKFVNKSKLLRTCPLNSLCSGFIVLDNPYIPSNLSTNISFLSFKGRGSKSFDSSRILLLIELRRNPLHFFCAS